MNTKFTILVAAGLLIAGVSQAQGTIASNVDFNNPRHAMASEHRAILNDRHEIRSDRREIRNDRREIKRDRHRIHHHHKMMKRHHHRKF
ncbi:MAG: hypothetical protein J0H74_35540 [Chitinophagaceae bacterium]|nr:hypothetical protein [Chitinophagaceae bacterium]